jgi:hypothetical protein
MCIEGRGKHYDTLSCNSITLRYLPGHYQALVPNDDRARRPTMDDIIHALDDLYRRECLKEQRKTQTMHIASFGKGHLSIYVLYLTYKRNEKAQATVLGCLFNISCSKIDSTGSSKGIIRYLGQYICTSAVERSSQLW